MRNHESQVKRIKSTAPWDMPHLMITWHGYNDVRNGLGYREEYSNMPEKRQRLYEAGRLRAATMKGSWGLIPEWKITEPFNAVLHPLPRDVYEDMIVENEYILGGAH